MAFMDVAKNEMLDAFTADEVSLHHGDPGTTGANEIADTTDYERQTPAWNAAANGERTNDGDIVFNISGDSGDDSKVAWVGLWHTGTFKAKAQVTEETFGADGTYTLPDNEGITLNLEDPV